MEQTSQNCYYKVTADEVVNNLTAQQERKEIYAAIKKAPDINTGLRPTWSTHKTAGIVAKNMLENVMNKRAFRKTDYAIRNSYDACC